MLLFNDCLHPDPANTGGPRRGLAPGEERKVDTRAREGERNERTISQIIWKDYSGFSQITLSTEGETEIKRLEKGYRFSAVSHTIHLILLTSGSFSVTHPSL